MLNQPSKGYFIVHVKQYPWVIHLYESGLIAVFPDDGVGPFVGAEGENFRKERA